MSRCIIVTFRAYVKQVCDMNVGYLPFSGRRQHRARRQHKKFRYPIFVEPFAVFFHFIRPFGYAHFHFKDTALLFFSI